MSAARTARANLSIARHVVLAMGTGTIPLPALDLVALTGVQLSLIRSLCRIYDIPFSDEVGRAALAALVGAALPVVQASTVASGLKTVPGLGTIAGVIATPLLAGATTFGVGKVFVQHLASGGTLLTFDSQKMKAKFEEELRNGGDPDRLP